MNLDGMKVWKSSRSLAPVFGPPAAAAAAAAAFVVFSRAFFAYAISVSCVSLFFLDVWSHRAYHRISVHLKSYSNPLLPPLYPSLLHRRAFRRSLYKHYITPSIILYCKISRFRGQETFSRRPPPRRRRRPRRPTRRAAATTTAAAASPATMAARRGCSERRQTRATRRGGSCWGSVTSAAVA